MNGHVFLTNYAFSVSFIILSGMKFAECTKLPCYFFDSINITDGLRQLDESIRFDGIDFPRHQYSVLNYIVDDGERIATKPYIRGCLCNIKPCFRLCCSNQLIEDSTNILDDNCNEELTQMEGEVFDEVKIFVNLVLDTQPIHVKQRTCKQFFIEKEIKNKIENVMNDFYILKCNACNNFVLVLQAGKVLRENKTASVRGYCQRRINDEIDKDDLNVSICVDWVEIIKPNENSDTRELLDFFEHICESIVICWKETPYD